MSGQILCPGPRPSTALARRMVATQKDVGRRADARWPVRRLVGGRGPCFTGTQPVRTAREDIHLRTGGEHADDHHRATARRSTTRTGARGQPVVFSHGWPLSADSWEAQMLFLASNGYPLHRARPPRPRPLEPALGRQRHGHLRRRSRGADRARSTCRTRCWSASRPAAARSRATSAATARSAWRRPC